MQRVYPFTLSRHKGGNTIEYVAKSLRRGEYNYISLESALSKYGVISQIPIDRLTVMTTGRKGTLKRHKVKSSLYILNVVTLTS